MDKTTTASGVTTLGSADRAETHPRFSLTSSSFDESVADDTRETTPRSETAPLAQQVYARILMELGVAAPPEPGDLVVLGSERLLGHG